MRYLRALVITGATVVGMATFPVEAKRVALVIGNSDYQAAGDLKNPVNDATALGSRLQQLGFHLVGGAPQLNVTRSQLVRLVRKFGKMLESGDTALVFYAGHGIGANGTNYLLPVDDDEIQSAEDLEDFAVGINSVMARMSKRGDGTNIVILDACRNNPLPATTRSGSGGLSRMSAPNGSFVAYAADPGAVAFDGDGQNGIFTGSLLAELQRPDRPLISIMRKVRRRVRALTGGKQTPWTEESLDEAFFFEDEKVEPVRTARAPQPASNFAPSTSNGSGWFTQKRPVAPAPQPLRQAPQQQTSTWQTQPAAPAPQPQQPAWQTPQQQAALRPVQPRPQPVAPQPAPQPQRVVVQTAPNPAPAHRQTSPAAAPQPMKLAALPNASDVPSRPQSSMVPAPAAPAPLSGISTEKLQKMLAYAGEMVRIAPGNFVMGIDESQVARKDKSRRKPAPFPQRNVQIGYGLAVGRYEVTFDQWDACVADGGCAHNPDDDGESRGNRPVMNVSWDDVQTYLKWLNAKLDLTGKPDQFRLPSESEWEYFARAGAPGAYPFGNNSADELCEYANLFDNSTWREFPDLTPIDCRDGYTRLAPVGEFEPNNFGVFDVIGNVSEWTEDCFHRNYKGSPVNGAAWTDGTKCKYRIIRGGSWFSHESESKSFARKRSQKHLRHQHVGFRIVRTLKN